MYFAFLFSVEIWNVPFHLHFARNNFYRRILVLSLREKNILWLFFLSPVPKNIFSELLFFLFFREHPHDYQIFTFFHFCNSVQFFLSSICRNEIVYTSICKERNVSFPVLAEICTMEVPVLYNSISPEYVQIDMPRPRFGPRQPAGEHPSKELPRQRINNYSEHLHETSSWLHPVHMLLNTCTAT